MYYSGMQDDTQCDDDDDSFPVSASLSATAILIIVLCLVIPLVIIGIVLAAGSYVVGNMFHFFTRKAYTSSPNAAPQETPVTFVQNPVTIVQNPVNTSGNVQFLYNPGEATAPPPKIAGTATEFTPSAPPETSMKWGRVV